MQPTTWNIVIGVVTGLVTSSILLIIKSLFINSFIPWYRSKIFNGFNLSGTWHAAGGTQKILLEIKQTCEKLTGKVTIHIAHEAISEELRDHLHIDDIRTFDLTGEISERFISLKFKHSDPTRIGLVIYLLQVAGDGTKLSGQGCWYAPLASRITSGTQDFYRDEARAIKCARKKDEEEQSHAAQITEQEELVDVEGS